MHCASESCLHKKSTSLEEILKSKKFRFKLFSYVGDTPVISTKWEIITVFVVMLFLSTFSTSLIAIMLSQRKTLQLSNIVMVDKLTDLYNMANNQKQIEAYSRDTQGCIDAIVQRAKGEFAPDELHAVAFGLNPDGSLLFFTSASEKLNWTNFSDKSILEEMENSENREGHINFVSPDGDEYVGVFKYHEGWLSYITLANRKSDINKSMYHVIGFTIILILLMGVFFIFIGVKIFDGLLSNIGRFSNQLYEMHKNKRMESLDISAAPNDDITYLAANFNSLSSTISNLLQIFQKFVPENVVRKAQEEQYIRLEGKQCELTILFSDIKSFTYRTEILGNDIIGLLNVHYDSVIRKVSENNGIIGSIIGDAILASYGIEENISANKSYDSIKTAWEITSVTHELRAKMQERRRELEKDRPLTESEERVYEAVMLDVGVGIDGGNVFYGNIGSSRRMANTVIGDNVNSASRLEGLTRIYRVPVIVSEYIMQDAKKDSEAAERYEFYEIDTVQVKGKTEGVKIYFPLDRKYQLEEWKFDRLSEKFGLYENGLKAYYEGDWKTARAEFKKSELDVAKVFLERMGMKSAPEDWSGIWTMTTK
jgi:class 3 adenylate cyclase